MAVPMIEFAHPTRTPWELLLVMTGGDSDWEEAIPHVVQYARANDYQPEKFSGWSRESYYYYDHEIARPPAGYDPYEASFDYFVGHGAATHRVERGSTGEFFPAWFGMTAMDAVIRGLDAGCAVSMEVTGRSYEGIKLFELLSWHRKEVRKFQESPEGNWNDIATRDGRKLYRQHLEAGGEVAQPHYHNERWREYEPQRLTAIACELLQEDRLAEPAPTPPREERKWVLPEQRRRSRW